MTFAMADSINASDLVNLPSRVVAFGGYDNGNWPDFQAIAAEHPGSYLVDFTVFRTNTGTGGDFEPGDMGPDDAVPYVSERLAAGVARPIVYASISEYMAPILEKLTAAGIARSSFRLLAAHYGYGPHICGPATCNLGGGIQCDGTQWADHADDGSGLGNWDESLLADDFFSSAPKPPAPPPGPTEEDMSGISRTVTTKDKTRHRASIIYPGGAMHSWLPYGATRWSGPENVAIVAAGPSSPHPSPPIAALTFDPNQTPSIDILEPGTTNEVLVIGAQEAVAGFSFEFDQLVGTSGWGAAQITGNVGEELTRIPQTAE
jgi:hypothetical protein